MASTVAVLGWTLATLAGALFIALWERASSYYFQRATTSTIKNNSNSTSSSPPLLTPGKDVLLVFAHPDDEAMFFAPFLEYCRQARAVAADLAPTSNTGTSTSSSATTASNTTTTTINVHFLCLSTGNAVGLGAVRSAELHQSAAYFGLKVSSPSSPSSPSSSSSSSVVLIDDPTEMPDSMKAWWPAQRVAAEVRARLEALSCAGSSSTSNPIGTIITFDAGGISAHPNHISVYEGVKLFAKEQQQQQQQQQHGGGGTAANNNSIQFFTLHSRPLLLKYCGVLSLLPAIVTSLLEEQQQQQQQRGAAAGQQGGETSSITSATTTTSSATTSNVVIAPSKMLSSLRAMQQHPSQLVWFRYLFVFFSSYTFLNEFTPLVE